MFICLDQGGQGGEIVAYLKICLYMNFKFVHIVSFPDLTTYIMIFTNKSESRRIAREQNGHW